MVVYGALNTSSVFPDLYSIDQSNFGKELHTYFTYISK